MDLKINDFRENRRFCTKNIQQTCLILVLQTMSIESVMASNHLILCRPLLLSPSIFPRIRVFSNESVLRIRWPKYWRTWYIISLQGGADGTQRKMIERSVCVMGDPKEAGGSLGDQDGFPVRLGWEGC